MIFIFVIGMPVLMRFVYPFPVLFRRLSTVFFIDSETNEAIPLHFRNVFHFFSEKNSLSQTFLVECAAKRPCKLQWEAGILARNSHTSVASDWLLIGRIIFFSFENHRSLLWLARTNLCTKSISQSVYLVGFFKTVPSVSWSPHTLNWLN